MLGVCVVLRVYIFGVRRGTHVFGGCEAESVSVECLCMIGGVSAGCS